METEVLKKIGLSDNEINAYLTLLRNGASPASEISKITKLHRTHVYDILDSLIKKGLVSSIMKEKTKFFQCAPPAKFMQILKDKEQELRKSEAALSSAVSELNKLGDYTQGNLTASIYLGMEGFKTVLDDMLNTKEDYLTMGYTPKTLKTLGPVLITFQRKRVELKIKRRMLMSPELKDDPTTTLPLQEVRFLPKEYHIPMGIIIYGDKVVIVIVDEEYMCISIQNKKINENFRKFFEMLWKISAID